MQYLGLLLYFESLVLRFSNFFTHNLSQVFVELDHLLHELLGFIALFCQLCISYFHLLF